MHVPKKVLCQYALACSDYFNVISLFLWAVSMIMFSTFEHSVNFLYQNVVKRPKVECSKVQQLGVTCMAGYASGAIGTIVSNPADNIVSALYNKKAKSVLEVRHG